jgi:hypothetical protein
MSLNKRDVFILASHRHEVTIVNLLLLLILLLLIIYRVLFSDRITCGRLVAGVLALTMLVAVAGSERGHRLQMQGVALGVQMANNTGARGFSGYGICLHRAIKRHTNRTEHTIKGKPSGQN